MKVTFTVDITGPWELSEQICWEGSEHVEQFMISLEIALMVYWFPAGLNPSDTDSPLMVNWCHSQTHWDVQVTVMLSPATASVADAFISPIAMKGTTMYYCCRQSTSSTLPVLLNLSMLFSHVVWDEVVWTRLLITSTAINIIILQVMSLRRRERERNLANGCRMSSI